jgi:O-antigen/teichoic acid export membrane protein
MVSVISLEFLLAIFFGDEFKKSVLPSIIVLLSLPFSFGARVLLNVCMAAGKVNAYSSSVFAKSLFLLVCLEVVHPASVDVAAAIVSVSEVAGLLLLAVTAKNGLNWTYSQTFALYKPGN